MVCLFVPCSREICDYIVNVNYNNKEVRVKIEISKYNYSYILLVSDDLCQETNH